MEKLIRDGKVGVIVSGGFGAGWATWSDSHEFFSMDKGLVELKLKDAPRKDVEAYMEGKEFDCPYMGGWNKARVEWVDQGDNFYIDEYDGSESLVFADSLILRA